MLNRLTVLAVLVLSCTWGTAFSVAAQAPVENKPEAKSADEGAQSPSDVVKKPTKSVPEAKPEVKPEPSPAPATSAEAQPATAENAQAVSCCPKQSCCEKSSCCRSRRLFRCCR